MPNLKDLSLEPSHYVSSTTARDAQAVCNLYQEILLLWTNNLEAFNVTVLPQTDGPALSKLLRAAFAKLRSFVLAGYRQNDDACVPFEIPPNSRLQSFKFAVSLGAKTTKGILGLLCGLTLLNSLNFHERHNNLSEVNISDEILELLAQNRLESLGFCDIGVSFLESLVDGLKENTSVKKLCQCYQTKMVSLATLKYFASMMEHNVLLEDVTFAYRYTLRRRDFRPTVAQIQYWADCNKCGRGKLSDPKAPLDELFVALETAKAKTPYSYYCPDKLWYGLLRANPGIWAEAALTGL
ncbi:expressed unknown protein [Seminavis robusta]|uniref:Uncharacterized protein n=1 Tax=Seminavis robusta TaxID=568900 RepID=A0A9N8HNB6_9STRA|nr:expressed unknown protein [Seminavis robusta]|eukprot:Sro1069_g237670.1 n/a (296) ;mRNA; f:35165-36052